MAGISQAGDLGLERLFGGGGPSSQAMILQIVASLVTCMVLAMAPLWSVIQEDRHRPSTLLKSTLVVLITSALASICVLGAHSLVSAERLYATFLVMIPQIIIIYCALRLVRSYLFILAALILVAGLLAINLVPVILEAVLLIGKQTAGGGENPTFLITLGPTALLAIIWGATESLSWIPGIVWQWVLAGGMVMITVAFGRKRKPPPAFEVLAAPPVATTPPVAAAHPVVNAQPPAQ